MLIFHRSRTFDHQQRWYSCPVFAELELELGSQSVLELEVDVHGALEDAVCTDGAQCII